jgi:hypothetical protein
MQNNLLSLHMKISQYNLINIPQQIHLHIYSCDSLRPSEITGICGSKRLNPELKLQLF